MIQDLFRNISKLGAQAQDMQKKISQITVEGQSGAGMVSVTLNGLYQVVSLEINDELISLDKKAVLIGMISAAINDASQKVQQKIQSTMQEIIQEKQMP